MFRRFIQGLILSALAWSAVPRAQAALPACLTQCSCQCGFGCLTNHACLFRARTVDHMPIQGQPNRYRITCYFRGNMRTDSQGTYFCCNHTAAVHGHISFHLNQ
jgi:hypothetical protein